MQKITLKISGMMCGMCESHINDSIRREFKVKKVASSHTKGITTIITQNPIDEEKIRNVINATGYTLVSINTEPYEKKGLFSHRK